MTKNKPGGARKGSGRKKQFTQPATIAFKCEATDKATAKKAHGRKLNSMFNGWLKSINPAEPDE